MGEITAYLVGKVGPIKWEMVKGVVGATFVSSDGSDHSEHDWVSDKGHSLNHTSKTKSASSL